MKLIAITLALAALAACGKKDSTPDDPPATDRTAPPGGAAPASAPTSVKQAAEPAADDRCEVTVEGDIKDQGVGPGGPSAAGTDYWMSDDELRKALEMMAGAFGDKAPDIDADMKKDPRIYTLIVNCQTPRTKISFLPSSGSKYADVPFGPKKYKIAASGGGKTPGLIHPMVTFEKDTAVWEVDGEGELDITKFDKTGIAGTFSFQMIERQYGTPTAPPRKAKITGKLAFKCGHPTSVCRGA